MKTTIISIRMLFKFEKIRETVIFLETTRQCGVGSYRREDSGVRSSDSGETAGFS